MSRWVRRKRSQNPTSVALPTSRNSIKKNAIEDIKLRLVMVNQLQIMVATVERRDDVAVRRKTPYVLLTVFFFKRRPKNPADEKFDPTINFIAIVHPLPTSDTAEVPCSAIHRRFWRILCKTFLFIFPTSFTCSLH